MCLRSHTFVSISTSGPIAINRVAHSHSAVSPTIIGLAPTLHTTRVTIYSTATILILIAPITAIVVSILTLIISLIAISFVAILIVVVSLIFIGNVAIELCHAMRQRRSFMERLREFNARLVSLSRTPNRDDAHHLDFRRHHRRPDLAAFLHPRRWRSLRNVVVRNPQHSSRSQ